MWAMIMKFVSSTYSQCNSKPMTVSVLTMLVAVAFYYAAIVIHGDPADLKKMKHGFIKVLPEHLSSFDESNPSLKVKDTLNCVVPPIVHYVWCRKDNFQFQNYLSVLSAYKLLKPTEIIFHYKYLPVRDGDGYYQFYEDLQRDLPNFFSEPLEDYTACSDDREIASEHLSKMLNKNGGIFIGVDVILSHDALKFLDKPLSGFLPDSMTFSSGGLLFQSAGILESSKDSLATKLSSSPIHCSPTSSFEQINPCVFLEEELFPFQIFSLKTHFGELARLVGYGRKDLLEPKLKDDLIPNIVHYVWLGKREFIYFDYMSLLSSLFIQKAETVYVHGNFEPLGEYWKEALKTGKVKFIHREFPKTVYGNDLKNPSHASDYIRFDLLLRYGGIYLDWDFLWVRELSEQQRRHEAIACFDWPLAGKYPETFNMGILGGVKGARYMKFMLETFRHYIDSDWGYNAIRIPYKVYEQHPESLFVDRHLQLICFWLICHPVFVPGYKKSLHNTDGGPFEWKTDSNGVHWTNPDPKEFKDEQTLISSTGVFAEIGQNVLRHAGIIR